MTAADLIAWRQRLGFDRTRAAAVLGCHRNSISHWETGRFPVPLYIELACRYVEEHKKTLTV
jgi:DNA-binding XRE family transcriptional regulator